MTLQIVRDWALKFNAHRPAGGSAAGGGQRSRLGEPLLCQFNGAPQRLYASSARKNLSRSTKPMIAMASTPRMTWATMNGFVVPS